MLFDAHRSRQSDSKDGVCVLILTLDKGHLKCHRAVFWWEVKVILVHFSNACLKAVVDVADKHNLTCKLILKGFRLKSLNLHFHKLKPWRDSSPKNLNSVIIYSTSSCFKAVWVFFFCWTWNKIFWRMWVTKQLLVPIDFHSMKKYNGSQWGSETGNIKYQSSFVFSRRKLQK